MNPLPLTTRLALALRLPRLLPVRPPAPLCWRSQPLPPTLHLGLAASPRGATNALATALAATAPARALLLDDGILADPARLVQPNLQLLRLTCDAANLPDALAIAALRGAFDLLLLAFETAPPDPARRATARHLLRTLDAIPPRPTLVLGVGPFGHRDHLIATLRPHAKTIK